MKHRLLAILMVLALLITCAPAVLAEEEPIKISVASYMFGPTDPEKDVVTPAVEARLKEEHGINVDIEIVYIEYAQYSDIINLRLAGNTAPDVFLSQSEAKMLDLYDQGVIASWDLDFFIENAPDVYKFITDGTYDGRLKDYVDMWYEKSMIGDKMVTVAKIKADGNFPYKTLMYRGDWIEALDVKEEDYPMTVDEYVDLMYRFAKEDPDGNGVDDTYGLSMTGFKPLFGAYGMYCGFILDTSYWYEVDGVLYNPDVSDEAKEIVTLLAQMFADGVIDPEFIDRERTPGAYWAISYPFINGKIGASAHAAIDHYRLKEVMGDSGGQVAREYWAVNGDDATFVYAPWPAGPEGDFGYCVGVPVGIGENALYNAALNDDPEKLATIFKILNAFSIDDDLAMLAVFGIEGVHWNYDENGTPMSIDISNEEKNEIGIWACRSLYGADTPYSQTMYGVNFHNNLTVINRYNWYDKPQYNSYIMNPVTVTLPSESELLGGLNTLRDETWISMIRGEVSIDDTWDEYVQKYMDLGGQRLFDEANDWYSSK